MNCRRIACGAHRSRSARQLSAAVRSAWRPRCMRRAWVIKSGSLNARPRLLLTFGYGRTSACSRPGRPAAVRWGSKCWTRTEKLPAGRLYPTGGEFVRLYLEPLARLLGGAILTETRVVALGRSYLFPDDHADQPREANCAAIPPADAQPAGRAHLTRRIMS